MILFLLIFFISSAIVNGQQLDEKLRSEIIAMKDSDQVVRKKLRAVSSLQEHNLLTQEIKKLDYVHTLRMCEIIKNYGWPGIKLVGEDGAQAAWLLVQHADDDIEFQKKCLELLKNAVAQQDASATELAYLTDRVLVNEGKPQLYGTQVTIINGKTELKLCGDLALVEQRRAKIGMEVLSEYFKRFESISIKYK